jgi:hypothetical protein
MPWAAYSSAESVGYRSRTIGMVVKYLIPVGLIVIGIHSLHPLNEPAEVSIRRNTGQARVKDQMAFAGPDRRAMS